MQATRTIQRARWREETTAALVWRRVALVSLLGFALWLRMREPLSSSVIGAEDPYTHMSNTWHFVHGGGFPANYPPGFVVLLAPFALLGQTLFYLAARFLPPFLGVVEVLGVYLLVKEHLRTPAAFVAAATVALIPENIFRTNLLFPTALDLALIPFYLLFLLRTMRRDRKALAITVGLVLVMGATHPWVLVYLTPPTLAAALFTLRDARSRWLAIGVLGALGLGALVFFSLPGAWNPAPAFLKHAGPRALELVRDPTSLHPLPPFVNPIGMLTWPAIALGAVGGLAALARRTPLGIVALVYTLAILPFVFVDWFDIWFISHRSVVYLSLGLALLAAVPIEMLSALPEWERADAGAAPVVIAGLLVLALPMATTVEPWYRLYDKDDYAAWKALDKRDVPYVVTGSWQAATGYRAITGEDGHFNPDFFRNDGVRRDNLARHPGLVVLIDNYARTDGFHAPAGWREVGRWGDNVAYAPR